MDHDNEGFTPPSLDDLLKGNAGADAEDAAPAAKEDTPPAAAPPEPPPAEPPADDATAPPAADPKTVPISVVTKIREELNRTKAKVAELEGQGSGRPPAEPQQPAQPDPMLDPEGYRAAIDWRTRVLASEAVMRGSKTDFDEVLGVYMEAASNGDLPLIPMNHPAPAQWAYEQGKKFQKLNELGDLDTLETRLREKWDADLKAAGDAAKAEAAAARKAAIMPTTAGDRSAAPKGDGGSWEPPSLETILNRKRKAAS